MNSHDFYRCRDIKNTSHTTDVCMKNNFMLVLNITANEKKLKEGYNHELDIGEITGQTIYSYSEHELQCKKTI